MKHARASGPARRKVIRKEESIRIRVTVAQKEALTEAASRDGLGVSSWLLMLGLRETQKATVTRPA
jgi:uncharacterized protein (DUF1778 family)